MGGGSMQKTLPRAAEPRIIRAERHAGYARSWANSKGLFLRPQGTVGRFRLMSMYSTPGQRACGLQRAWLRNPGAAGGQVLAEAAEGGEGQEMHYCAFRAPPGVLVSSRRHQDRAHLGWHQQGSGWDLPSLSGSLCSTLNANTNGQLGRSNQV